MATPKIEIENDISEQFNNIINTLTTFKTQTTNLQQTIK